MQAIAIYSVSALKPIQEMIENYRNPEMILLKRDDGKSGMLEANKK